MRSLKTWEDSESDILPILRKYPIISSSPLQEVRCSKSKKLQFAVDARTKLRFLSSHWRGISFASVKAEQLPAMAIL